MMSAMDRDLAGLSRTIDPAVLGRRIRDARLAAGLTQAELGGAELSGPYVSRVESGQRRPGVRVLELIAGRLGMEVADLLNGPDLEARTRLELGVDHADLALTSGNASGALALLGPLLPEIRKLDGELLFRRARQIEALALEAVGDPQGAILILEDLANTDRHDATWISGLIALSRNYRESGDLARAIDVGEKAATIIDDLGLTGLTESIQLALTVAGAYLHRGDTDFAMRICQRALRAAESQNSQVAKASAYWNASVAESQRGNPTAALALARKALTLFESSDDARNLGRLRTQVAAMHLSQDPPDPASARATLRLARVELDTSSASSTDHAAHLIVLGRSSYLLGDLEDAEEQVGRAAVLADLKSPLLSAQADVLRGQIKRSRGDVPGSCECYRSAVRALTMLGADRDAAQLWFEVGELLDESGRSIEARDAYRRAAASTGLRPSVVPTPV